MSTLIPIEACAKPTAHGHTLDRVQSMRLRRGDEVLFEVHAVVVADDRAASPGFIGVGEN